LRKQIWLKDLQEADGLRDVEVARRTISKLIRNSGAGYGLGLSGAWYKPVAGCCEQHLELRFHQKADNFLTTSPSERYSKSLLLDVSSVSPF
jgi:hypothetical protein